MYFYYLSVKLIYQLDFCTVSVFVNLYLNLNYIFIVQVETEPWKLGSRYLCKDCFRRYVTRTRVFRRLSLSAQLQPMKCFPFLIFLFIYIFPLLSFIFFPLSSHFCFIHFDFLKEFSGVIVILDSQWKQWVTATHSRWREIHSARNENKTEQRKTITLIIY